MAGGGCTNCGEALEPALDLCWRCGAHKDGSPPGPEFSGVAAVSGEDRELDCLRCQAPMVFAGRLKLHEGSRAFPFPLGNVGELLVNRESFDSYACPRFGKVEFFLAG